MPTDPEASPGSRPAEIARWLTEAFESGNPLAALPPELAPRDAGEAAEAAAALLDSLEIIPCGLRLLRRDGAPALAGPMTEQRLMGSPAAISLVALRHPRVTAAAVGVLAEALDPDSAAPPVFTRIHPALDIATTRFTTPPADDLSAIADLAGLGLVVAGRGKVVPPGVLRVALAPKGSRSRGGETDLAAAFAEAAAAARAWGGLPAGAVLVVAGLTPAAAPEGTLRAALGALGAAEASFA